MSSAPGSFGPGLCRRFAEHSIRSFRLLKAWSRASSVEGFSSIAERRRRVGRTKSAIQPIKDALRHGEIGGSSSRAIHDRKLVLKEKQLRNEGTDATGTEQPGQGSDEVDEENDQIAHRGIIAVTENP